MPFETDGRRGLHLRTQRIYREHACEKGSRSFPAGHRSSRESHRSGKPRADGENLRIYTRETKRTHRGYAAHVQARRSNGTAHQNAFRRLEAAGLHRDGSYFGAGGAFLDEPTLGLDVLARRELWSAIQSLKGRITVILTTHYMEEAEQLSDRIAIMVSGKLRAVGTLSELEALTGEKGLENAFIKIAEAREGGMNA